jgi:hypothetical protein
VRDEIHVQSVYLVSVCAKTTFEQILGLLGRCIRRNQTEAAGDSMNVSIDRHSGQTEREQQDARCSLWTNAFKIDEPASRGSHVLVSKEREIEVSLVRKDGAKN